MNEEPTLRPDEPPGPEPETPAGPMPSDEAPTERIAVPTTPDDGAEQPPAPEEADAETGADTAPPDADTFQPFPNLREDLADADALTSATPPEPEDDKPPRRKPKATPRTEEDREPPTAAMAGSSYRIALDAYCGPLDLLLYLIRKNEVDIYDIPVALVAEQYQQYIEAMAEINVNVAGEFLVMAATLMEVKSRMLLPTEEATEEDDEDPRAELVRQLLEYKKYKDLARQLGDRAAEQALKFPRPEGAAGAPEEAAPEAEEAADSGLEGIGLWELIEAFAKVLHETSLVSGPRTQTLEHERPLHEYRRDLLRVLTSKRRVTFSQVFTECRTRDDLIAMFVALLELVRLKRVGLQQPGAFGEIYIHLAEDPEAKRLSAADAAVAEEDLAPEPVAETEAEPEAPPAKPANGPPVAPRQDDAEMEAYARAQQRADEAIQRIEQFLQGHHEPPTDGNAGDAPEEASDEPPAETDGEPEPDRNRPEAPPTPPGEAEAPPTEPNPAERQPSPNPGDPPDA